MNNLFTKITDWISEAMGTPLNITIWLILVLIWFLIFAICPELQNSSFMPDWFTSNAFNFPLNTVTTLIELFIGFILAAAANRVEKRNWELHQKMQQMLIHIENLSVKEEAQIEEILHQDQS